MRSKRTLVQDLVSDLKQQRDQLRIKVHLGGMEVKEEFQKLDDRLNQLSHRFDPLKESVGETAESVWESIQQVGSEIKEGFVRIRKSME